MTAHTSATTPRLAVQIPSRLGLAAVLALLIMVGCNEQPRMETTSTPPVSGKVTVQQMSQDLGLKVVYSSCCNVVMKNPANTVLLYADPNGQAYVNGRPVGSVGGFDLAGDTMYVPSETVSAIRSSLRPWVQVTNVSHDVVAPPVKPTPGKGKHASGKVVLDPGHGGGDPGTVGHGANEKAITLALATSVAQILRQRGVDVVLTRATDAALDANKNADLNERVDIANRAGAKLFVSIHVNHVGNSTIHGHQVLVPEVPSAKANLAAQDISKELTAAGMDAHGTGVRKDDRGLRVLRGTKITAVLVEVGFLSNAKDAVLMTNRAQQQRLAEGIADGIIDYLNR